MTFVGYFDAVDEQYFISNEKLVILQYFNFSFFLTVEYDKISGRRYNFNYF